MKTKAALMTGKGSAAISCVSIFGDTATQCVCHFLRAVNGNALELKPSQLRLADFIYNSKIIDQVLVAFEDDELITINAHGNPLIIETILLALSEVGVEIVSPEELMQSQLGKAPSQNVIESEAKLNQCNSKTYEGTCIITNQIKAGLNQIAKNWLIETDFGVIKEQALDVLEKSKIANLIINGANVVIAGSPNSGKSTLLNQLCGREKAIVADIAGTTRDWITASCSIESLWLDLYDTAGLDADLAKQTDLDKVSQETTFDIITKADLIIYLFDASELSEQKLIDTAGLLPENTPAIAGINKIDIANTIELNKVPSRFTTALKISAKNGDNITALIKSIREVLGVDTFDSKTAIYFTERQENIIRQIEAAKTIEEAKKLAHNLIEI